MKKLILPAFLSLFLASALPALALDIVPYSAQALDQAQKAGKGVALHFHADWCPTCRAQSKVFESWKGDAKVPGTLMVADYDKEKALKQKLGVRSQSTLIFYKGGKEESRLSGVTDPADLRQALRAIE